MRWAWVFLAGCSFSDGVRPRSDGAVVPDAPPDAAVDAGFDPATCPPTYTVMISSRPSSRYRIETVGQTYAKQHATCLGDSAGLTHLVVFDDQVEAAEVGAQYGAVAGTGPNSVFYVGALQQPTQATPAQNWFWITGAPMTLAWQPGSPNDNDQIENNHNNAGRSLVSGKLEDAVAALKFNAVCECDGKAIDMTIASFVP